MSSIVSYRTESKGNVRDLHGSLVGDPRQEYIEVGGLCRRGIQLEAKISLALIQTTASNMLSTRNLDKGI